MNLFAAVFRPFIAAPNLAALFLLVLLVSTGCRSLPDAGIGAPPRSHVLRPAAAWQIEAPNAKPFDASGLLLRPDAELWTLSDKEPVIYRLAAPPGGGVARVSPVGGYFTERQLGSLAAEKRDRYDIEGLAQDETGRLYVAEEANRWILRFSPDAATLDRLPIDWTPVRRFFHPTDANASFEGVAVLGQTLYVANERSLPQIVKVDLKSGRVTGSFSPTFHVPLVNEAHYTDLAVWRGHLFVLVRSRAQVLEIDPATERVVAEFNAGFVESDPEFAYLTRYGTGNLEGLAVDDGGFWLVTDNNGLGRKRHPQDLRPTLFRCPWPEGSVPPAPPR